MGLFNKKKKEEDVLLSTMNTSSKPFAQQQQQVSNNNNNNNNNNAIDSDDDDDIDRDYLEQVVRKNNMSGSEIRIDEDVDYEKQIIFDSQKLSNSNQQLEASPITVYATEYQESNAMKIASNESFCCYGIRNGLVRCLSQHTQSRSLLRGNETQIASMEFLPPLSLNNNNKSEGEGNKDGFDNILATLSDDGTLFIRKLYEDESSETISEVLLLKLDFSQEVDTNAEVIGVNSVDKDDDQSLIVPRFRWISRDEQNVTKAEFLVAFGNALFKSSVDLTEDSGSQSPIPFEERVDMEMPITSIDVINRTQVVATTKNHITVYELEPHRGFTRVAIGGNQNIGSNTLCARWMNETTLTSFAGKPSGQGAGIEICCHSYNKSKGTLDITQRFTIPNDSESSYCNSWQFAKVGYKNKQCFVFADSKRNVIYALSVNENENKFNWISQFSVSQPILSFVALDVSNDDDVNSAQFGLFCMQTGAIQQLRLPMLDCVRLTKSSSSVRKNGLEQHKKMEISSFTASASSSERAASPAVTGQLLTPDMFKKSLSISTSADELAPGSPENKPPPPSAVPVVQPQSKSVPAPQATTSSFTTTATTTATGEDVAKLLRDIRNELKQDRDKLRKEREQRDKAERERQNQLIQLISHATTKDLPSAISKLVSEQLSENSAAVQAALATNAAAAQRAAAAAAKEAVQTTLQSEIRVAMQQVMIPAFERSTQTMFNQIANTFDRAIGELNSELMQIRDRSVQANAMPLIEELQRSVIEMRSLPQALDSALKSSVSNAFGAVSAPHHHQQQTHSQGGGVGNVRSLADLEQKQQQVVIDPTAEIKRALNAGNLDAAFSQALSTSNLEIVSWLCSQVPPDRVFGQHPCPLSPFVLLSLAQQLSSDLTTKDAERKLDWIRDTCLAIDPQDPALKLHVRPVLTSVYESLRKLGSSSQNITPAVKAAARLVVHVVNSLLSACP